jgi:uncharacterized membrane protein YoaK (UPF0700 family)
VPGAPHAVVAPADDDQGGLPDLVVTALSFGTGAMDAFAFLRLGHVFASVMTGNLVLLGVSAGQLSPPLAIHAGIAIGAYAVGTVLGTRFGPAGEPIGWRSTAAALGPELALLAALAIVWAADPNPAGSGLADGLLGMAAVAMGVQSSVVRRSPVASTPTPYLTSTLTAVVASLSLGGGPGARRRRFDALVAVVAGAAAEAGLLAPLPRVGAALPAIGVATALVLAGRRSA